MNTLKKLFYKAITITETFAFFSVVIITFATLYALNLYLNVSSYFLCIPLIFICIGVVKFILGNKEVGMISFLTLFIFFYGISIISLIQP